MSRNPNGPRAQLLAESRRFRTEIIDMLTGLEGGATVTAICDQVGGIPRTMRQRLARMIAEGEIHSVMVRTFGAPSFARYVLGPGEQQECKTEVWQRTVSKWKPPTIKHHPLHAAFFGIQQ